MTATKTKYPVLRFAIFGLGVFTAWDLVDAPRPLTREDDRRLNAARDACDIALNAPDEKPWHALTPYARRREPWPRKP